MPKCVRLNMGGFIHAISPLSVSTAPVKPARTLGAYLPQDLGQSALQVGTTSQFHPSFAMVSSCKMTRIIVLSRNKQFLSMMNSRNIRRMSTTSDDVELTNNVNVEVMENKLPDHDEDAADTKIKPVGSPTKNISIMDKRPLSLANLASSMSLVQARKAASTDLYERITTLENEKKHLLTAAEIGKMKHQMVCRHRHTNLRHPLVCRKCWTYLPICVCPLFERGEVTEENDALNNAEIEQPKASLPIGVERVVVWTHHEEWGRTSNTGSLLPLGLERTDMFMKGLEEHDDIMDELLRRDDLTPVVLWPGKGRENNETTTISELQRRVVENKQIVGRDDDECSNKKTGIVLISIEGTWNNARKMVNKLPPKVLRLDLGEEIAANFSMPERNGGIFCNSNYPSLDLPTRGLSLLAPLRRQKYGREENVSTLEATVVALLALGLGIDDAGRILRVARTKVDRLLRYTGKTYPR